MNGLSDRTPFTHSVTIPSNACLPKAIIGECNCYYVKPELHQLGAIDMKTTFGNVVRCYDAERTVCDLLRSRTRIDEETVIAAIKNYAESRNKDLNKLSEYAKQFKVEKDFEEVSGGFIMSSKAMSLKGKIKNYAKSKSIAAQVVLQNYMFERFLARLSMSDYREKFVVKGGMLIAAIVGLDTGSTMDLDTTLRNLPLTEEKVMEAVENICKITLGDDVIFEVKSIAPIRKDDRYGGFCVRLDAIYDTIVTPLSIDVSTGDVITPEAVEYEFSGIFDEEIRIKMWGYNIESVMAEKVETILSRGIFNTRPRDFYDVYILGTTQRYDKKIFLKALEATAIHRGSREQIIDKTGIIEKLSASEELIQMWEKYRKKFSYASEIQYADVMDVLIKMFQ